MVRSWHEGEEAFVIGGLTASRKARKFTTLLGFNEPDGADQANLPVETALAAWPQLESVGARLGSPAGEHPDVPWMTEFMATAKKNRLRVDFITVHWFAHRSGKNLRRIRGRRRAIGHRESAFELQCDDFVTFFNACRVAKLFRGRARDPMIKHLPFTNSLLNSLSALVPELRIEIANSKLIRGQTAKGRYDIRIWGEGTELRTSFLGRGRNPLKQSKILLRTPLSEVEQLQEHAIAVRENERRLPWIQRSRDSQLGDDIVMVKPFGDDPDGPVVSVRTSALTGFISLEVQHAREMSPAEAKLVAKALSKAAKLAAVSKVEPSLAEAA